MTDLTPEEKENLAMLKTLKHGPKPKKKKKKRVRSCCGVFYGAVVENQWFLQKWEPNPKTSWWVP
jgi:hypothetical protein